MIKVVAALIENDGKFLIAKRSTGDKNVLGKWEFPGGKVKENESELKAIEREIKEEFEIDVKAKEFVTNNIFPVNFNVSKILIASLVFKSANLTLSKTTTFFSFALYVKAVFKAKLLSLRLILNE